MPVSKKRKRKVVAKNEAMPMLPIVEPENWQPVGERALTMVVLLGTATLRGGIPAEIAKKLPQLVGRDRQQPMNCIINRMETIRHLDQEEGRMCLMAATALALSTGAGAMLREFELGGATLTYTITPMDTSTDYNWRLTVEPSEVICH